MNLTLTRRMFASRLTSVLTALGITATASVRAMAQTSGAQDANPIRKLNSEGKPGGEKDVIMPVIVHNGLIYVSGQGAHDTRDQKEWTIESHTTMVMDKVKKHVEIGGRNNGYGSSGQCFPCEDRTLGWNAQGVRDLLSTWRAGAHDGRSGRFAGRFAGGNQLHRGRRAQIRGQGAIYEKLSSEWNRRGFLGTAAAVAASILAPRKLFSTPAGGTRRQRIWADWQSLR